MRPPSLLTAAAAAATLISSAPAHATIRLANDPGGLIAAYQQRFEHARATGEHIIIDGSCLSACTLAIGLVPKEQVCVTPKAVLGFHSAWQPTRRGRATSIPATQHMMNIYPAELQSWIKEHGGLTPHMIFLKGDELNELVSTCSDSEIAAARSTVVAHHQQPHHHHRHMLARGNHLHRLYAVRPMMMAPNPLY